MCSRGRPRGQGRPRGLHLWQQSCLSLLWCCSLQDIYVAAAYKTAFRNGYCRYLQCLTDAICLADNRISEIVCLCCTTCDIGLNLLS